MYITSVLLLLACLGQSLMVWGQEDPDQALVDAVDSPKQTIKELIKLITNTEINSQASIKELLSAPDIPPFVPKLVDGIITQVKNIVNNVLHTAEGPILQQIDVAEKNISRKLGSALDTYNRLAACADTKNPRPEFIADPTDELLGCVRSISANVEKDIQHLNTAGNALNDLLASLPIDIKNCLEKLNQKQVGLLLGPQCFTGMGLRTAPVAFTGAANFVAAGRGIAAGMKELNSNACLVNAEKDIADKFAQQGVIISEC